ncbi:MAG: hypothetical protein QXT16_08125 [Candidatus Caldarchaeum sp.]
MNVEGIRQDLRDIRIFCGRYFPFLVIPLSYVRVVATELIPTACVDALGTLVINPRFWSTLSIEEKRFVAMHEMLHISLCHPFRKKGFDSDAYNIAADGKVNHALCDAGIQGIIYSRGDEVTLEKISELIKIDIESLVKMSTEEIAKELEKTIKGKCDAGNFGRGRMGKDLVDSAIDGEVVQEGDKSLTDNTGNLEEKWKRILQRAKDFAKQAGNMPAGLERLVDEVLEVKPPWYIIARIGLRNHEKEDSSFAYPSRRGDEYPGFYGYHYNVWCLVDTSGSISEEELKLFLGIIKHEASRATVYAIPWDGEAYEVLRADNPGDVARRIAPRMRGGGGTVIAPALLKTMKLINAGDAVIILTDGDIFDEKKEETKRLFKKLASMASFTMLGYTRKPVYAPGFTNVRIDLKHRL